MPPTRPHPSPFGTRENRICAVAAAKTAAEMARQVRAGLKETRTIELRLDWLKSDAERRKLLRWLARRRFRSATFLATCRRKVAGGGFKRGLEAGMVWVVGAEGGGCGWGGGEVGGKRRACGSSLVASAMPA